MKYQESNTKEYLEALFQNNIFIDLEFDDVYTKSRKLSYGIGHRN
jgi:hypothetical protein